MNRIKKEELRKYREARAGLSLEEIEALDRREAEEKAFEDQSQLWHGRLFPEEYDFLLDSNADASERALGKNPMSDSFVARTDARRKALVFAGYMDDGIPLPRDTRGWIETMLRDGQLSDLESIYDRRKAEDETVAAANAPENDIAE